MSGSGLWSPRERASAWTSPTVLLALFLIAILSGCGITATDPTPEPTSEPPPASPTTPPAPTATTVAAFRQAVPAGAQALPSIADLVERVKPSVASITVDYLARGLFFDFPEEGAGSGIVLRSDGYIVTNAHVIRPQGEIRVHLPSGRSYVAEVIGMDEVSDLAVLKIDGENLPEARFASSSGLRVGDWVVTIGNALALKGGPTVTIGIVSGLGRTVTTDGSRQFYDLIQTDAAINDGNSGGPLVNLDGEVVGINHTILRQAQGMGFAISATEALPIIDSLIEHGRVIRPLIGLNGVDVTPARADQLDLKVSQGVIVSTMTRDGPAYKAGIRVADVITSLDGIPTPDLARFLKLLWSYDIGDEVNVQYIHQGQTLAVTVVLTERPP